MPMLLNAVGSTQIPGLLLFEEMLTATPIEIANQCEFKTLLLEAIKRSIDINGSVHPVADLLYKSNKRTSKSGWLFNLGPKNS